MKTAFLLRHADAEIGTATLPDNDRSLSAHGRQCADLIGIHLASRIQDPLLILCSAAQRTVETLERVGARLGAGVQESIDPNLYLASCQQLLECLQEIDDTQACVLLIAHNPGIASLAASLVTDTDPHAARMNVSYPSAALAEIEFDCEHWSQLRSGCGALRQFTTPQDLG